MFTYLIFKSPLNLAGMDLAGRIFSKQAGIFYLRNPEFAGESPTAGGLNALETLPFDKFSAVFSEQDVLLEDNFLKARWNPLTFTFDPLAGADLSAINTFITQSRAMWAARRAMIQTMKATIVNPATTWASLTRQHRKLLLQATIRDLTEADWDALGVGDASYIGDHNLPIRVWDWLQGLFN